MYVVTLSVVLWKLFLKKHEGRGARTCCLCRETEKGAGAWDFPQSQVYDWVVGETSKINVNFMQMAGKSQDQAWSIFYWPHNAIAMLNRLMQLFVQFFSQHMSLLHKFNNNSNRHTRLINLTGRNTEPVYRGKYQLRAPRIWERRAKMIKCFYGNWLVIVTAHIWFHWEIAFEDSH